MGRPIRKVNFGIVGTLGSGDKGIKVSTKKTGSAADGYIIKQRGSKKFKVNNATDGDFLATLDAGNGSGVATVNNTVVIRGYVAGSGANTNPATSGGTLKRAAKITQRRFIASDGTRYKWTLVDDSTQDYIELTAI